jgi:hypothetical protein
MCRVTGVAISVIRSKEQMTTQHAGEINRNGRSVQLKCQKKVTRAYPKPEEHKLS